MAAGGAPLRSGAPRILLGLGALWFPGGIVCMEATHDLPAVLVCMVLQWPKLLVVATTSAGHCQEVPGARCSCADTIVLRMCVAAPLGPMLLLLWLALLALLGNQWKAACRRCGVNWIQGRYVYLPRNHLPACQRGLLAAVGVILLMMQCVLVKL